MTATDTGSQYDFEAFERRNSASGLLLRYARRRIDNFRNRQLLTAVGSVTLWALSGPWIALASALLVLAGETLECLYLRRLRRWGTDADLPHRFVVFGTLAATVQGLTIAAWVTLVWTASDGGATRFFALAFLAAAALDAGMAITHQPQATRARLSIYAATGAGLFVIGAPADSVDPLAFGFDLLAALVLAHSVVLFIQFVDRSFWRRVEVERALLKEKLEVARTSAELQKREAAARHLALVAEHANDKIHINGRDGRIEWINQTFTRVTGYTPEQAIGQVAGEIQSGPNTDPTTLAELHRAKVTGRLYRGEILNRTAEGRDVWMEVILTPILDADGAVLASIGVERDISRAKTRERDLAEAKAAAEEAAEAKGRFLATMSHEMRTPLNGIIGMAELLAREELGGEAREQVEVILQSSEALLSVIGDVLELSKLEAGRVELIAEPFDPAQCLSSAVRLLAPMAEEKGLAMTLELDEGLPSLVTGDAGRMRQVVLNLMGNAVKFTTTGGVRVRASYEAGSDLVAEVEDTGPGIAGDQIERVFEAFSQEDAETARRFGGTGLGLSISRTLAREMGGDVVARSTLGAGSRFTATFCLPRSADQKTAWPARDSDRAFPVLAGMQLLVVEDNRTNCLLVEKFLAGLGVVLHFASDGAAGVAAFAELAPDVVLMDVSMPVLDGLEATRRIRREEIGQRRVCPIVGLTANAFEEDRQRCLHAGMTDFLAKPIRREALLSCLCAARRSADVDTRSQRSA